MQAKKIKKLIISFVPAFQISNLSGTDFLFRDLFDYLIENNSYYELENAGEQFLQCANINPMVKILAGFLSSCVKGGAGSANEQKYDFYYSSRFASRDIIACLENFISAKDFLSENIKCIDYEYRRPQGSKPKLKLKPESGSESRLESGLESKSKSKTINESLNSFDSPNRLNRLNLLNPQSPLTFFDPLNRLNSIENLVNNVDSISGYDFMVSNYKKNSGMDKFKTVEELNPDMKYLFIIGSAPPLFRDLFDYLGSWNLKIAYFEYPDILIKSADASSFTPELVLNVTSRLDNMLKITGFLRKANPKFKIGFIHTFPKFSHYEIEDHFFYKNITERYLSLEYAGGEKLSERDKIRLESFIKIIN